MLEFVTGLLNNVGTHIDPTKLIQVRYNIYKFIYRRRSNYVSFKKLLFLLRNATLEIWLAKLRRKLRKTTHN